MEKKLVLFNIKLEKDLRDAFVATCSEQDSTAAQEVRKFMRDYVKKHGQKKLV